MQVRNVKPESTFGMVEHVWGRSGTETEKPGGRSSVQTELTHTPDKNRDSNLSTPIANLLRPKNDA